jgi:hypothetical protein
MSRYTETRYEENFPGANLTDEEREFVEAVERYKRQTRRRFPSWSELLRLAKRLGYRKVAVAPAADPEAAGPPAANAPAPQAPNPPAGTNALCPMPEESA